METSNLSAEADVLLRRRMAREWVGVTEDNRPVYRELVVAGLMEPLSTFLHGKEGYYRPTEAAIGWISGNTPSSQIPEHAAAASPRG